jgi:hypothetical protein
VKGPGHKRTLLDSRGDFDRGVVGLELDHCWLVAEPFHLACLRLPLARLAVDRDKLIAQHDRPLASHEDVADPATGATLPLRAEALDIAAGHTNSSEEFAALSLETTSSSQHKCYERDDDDQIDAENREQCYQHGGPSPSTRPSSAADSWQSSSTSRESRFVISAVTSSR